MLRVEQVRELEPLRREWVELFARCPRATPFQHPDWLISWWQLFHPGKLAALSLRLDGRLVGLAPMYVSNGTLLLIGAGITDYLDVLIDPALEEEALPLLLQGALDFEWNSCHLDELPSWSPLLLGRPAQAASVCPVAGLPVSISSKLRSNLRQARAKLERSANVEFETATSHGHAELLDALFRLHRARWEERGETGVLATPEMRSFHERVAEGFSASGMLRLHALRVDGEIAAVWYWFARKRRAYCYLSGLAPRLARFSPGSLLTEYAVSDATGRGDTECDFLRGSEAYKYAWGARDRPNYRLSGNRRTLQTTMQA